MRRLPFAVLLCAPLLACGPANLEPAVARQYVMNIHANYGDALAKAEALKTAVDAFVAQPSAQTHQAAKQAWLDARPGYGQTEVTRFFGGPIDVPEGREAPEGRLNAWPIDESFIDYSSANPNAGMINHVDEFPKITPQVLAEYNGRAGEENRALGYHAIEFLLWGQRVGQVAGPGERPFTDYVDGGTAKNQARRRQYLQLAAQLLVSDLAQQRAAWDLADPDSYGSAMVAGDPKLAVTRILRGMSNMAISELLYERMSNPYFTRESKDEQSCFSESTWNDLAADGLGVENVYLGRYGEQHGASISDLVRQQDPALDRATREAIAQARGACEEIPQPFDRSVLAPDGAGPREKVKASIDAWIAVEEKLTAVGTLLHVDLNIVP
jgi:putative iron-regulated protein